MWCWHRCGWEVGRGRVTGMMEAPVGSVVLAQMRLGGRLGLGYGTGQGSGAGVRGGLGSMRVRVQGLGCGAGQGPCGSRCSC